MLKCYINSIEYRLTSDFEIREQTGSVSVCSIEILLEGQSIPRAQDIVEIKDDSTTPETPVFFGIVAIPQSPKYSTGYEVKKYKIQVQSGEAIMSRRFINNAWQDKTVSYIVNDLFTDYVSEEGIALGSISTIDITFASYVCPDMKLQDVLDELASHANAVWMVSADKKFYFLARDDFPIVVAPSHISSLQKTTNALDLRTVQVVAGVTDTTSQQSKTVTWETDQASFDLSYPISQEPSVTINESPVGVGMAGIDSGDASVTFLYTYGSKTVNVNPIATVQPTEGDIVHIEYYGLFNVRIRSQNNSKISEIASRTGTSGKIENIYIDQTIVSTLDASLIADNLLLNHDREENTVMLYTHDMNASQRLRLWTLNYPDYDIQGDFVVVERTIVYRKSDGSDEEYGIICKLKNRNYMTGYGKTLNKFSKDIRSLSIREDENVLTNALVSDDITLSEFVAAGEAPTYYATDDEYMLPEALQEPFYPVY